MASEPDGRSPKAVAFWVYWNACDPLNVGLLLAAALLGGAHASNKVHVQTIKSCALNKSGRLLKKLVLGDTGTFQSCFRVIKWTKPLRNRM